MSYFSSPGKDTYVRLGGAVSLSFLRGKDNLLRALVGNIFDLLIHWLCLPDGFKLMAGCF